MARSLGVAGFGENQRRYAGGQEQRFYASAPLVTASHHTIGTLCVMDNKARPDLCSDEEAMLRDLAELAMAEIEVRRLTGVVVTKQKTNSSHLAEGAKT
jgi:GAF domain-containing protein